MARVNPFILQTLRRRKGWSQDRLSERAGVNKQTISRIERGKQDSTQENTIKLLARALGAEPDELTREALAPETDSDSEPVRRGSESSFGVSVAADNFLYLISERYFVKPWQVMELAPLLFCWAAEMSLRERRARLDKLEETIKAARALEHEMPYLPVPNFTYSEEKIAAEDESINAHDIFSTCIDRDNFSDGPFYPHEDDTDNPFAMFLAKLVDSMGDVATFEGFSPIDFPIFEVCRKEALELVGGDEVLADRILTGCAMLSDMPKKMQGNRFSMTKERAEWVRERAEEYASHFVTLDELLGRSKKAST